MISKRVLLSLRQELYEALEKEAKENYMKLQDLIYLILVKHVKKDKFEEVFTE